MKLVTNIILDFAKVELLENNIVRLEILDKCVIGEHESREMNTAIGVLTNYQVARILIVSQPSTVFDHGARDFSASDEGLKFTIGDALVVSNLAQRILVSFYLKFNKPKKPSKAFDNEEDAMAWL
ncbi:MAG: hypothetical protein V4506_05845, partial [Bacteroidota bacterium]